MHMVRCKHLNCQIMVAREELTTIEIVDGEVSGSTKRAGPLLPLVSIHCSDCGGWWRYARRWAPKWLKRYLESISGMKTVMTKLYKKYIIEKTSGEPVDPEAQYFVLRLDTDKHARHAMYAYIDSVRRDSEKFAEELWEWMDRIIANQNEIVGGVE